MRESVDTVKHLYHDSSDGAIELFEPRQAVTFGKSEGQPAVHATDELEAAIFMAVLGSRHVGGWGLLNKTKLGFFIIDSHLEEAKQKSWSGYVYTLPKKTFSNRKNWEWIPMVPVKSVESFAVGIDDLPKDIHIMTSQEYENYHQSQTTE